MRVCVFARVLAITADGRADHGHDARETRVFRECRGVGRLERVAERDGPFTGAYCVEANAEIAAKLLDMNQTPEDAKRRAESERGALDATATTQPVAEASKDAHGAVRSRRTARTKRTSRRRGRSTGGDRG